MQKGQGFLGLYALEFPVYGLFKIVLRAKALVHTIPLFIAMRKNEL